MAKNNKSKWGIGVFILYGGFVLFILVLVMYVSIQDIQLVEEEYYQKDLAYQQQIDRIDRTNQLEEKLILNLPDENGNMLIKFPVKKNKEISGTIKFFRPSNDHLDFELPVETDSLGILQIDTKTMARGFWKVKVNWTIDSVEYFKQEPLMIN